MVSYPPFHREGGDILVVFRWYILPKLQFEIELPDRSKLFQLLAACYCVAVECHFAQQYGLIQWCGICANLRSSAR